jgi:uncharacterized protein YjbI with pentapeptide repeats
MQFAVMLLLMFVGGAAEAFDMHDIRLLRDSGYRWCRGCDLSEANLQDAELSGAQLQNADLAGAQLQDATLRFAEFQGASLVGAQLQDANLIRVQLQNADLRSAQLQDANLSSADLQDADVRSAQLQDANLALAYLKDAKLRSAQLQNADLRSAQLQNADLRSAQLQNAHLNNVLLNGADLSRANVEGARLSHANLTNAVYQPASPPPDSYVTGIRGLDTVRVKDTSGLVQLRALLQRAGHRDLEREATCSIERVKTHHALDRWRERPLGAVEAIARLIFFEWPVAYGLHPSRALLILVVLMLLFSFAYLPWIGQPGRARERGGAIYRIWPNGRLLNDGGSVQLLNDGDLPIGKRAERLQDKSILRRYRDAFHFSLLSAFHLGWREFSIGTWLSRLQGEEYGFRAHGWPRRISGAQSLISVYLVAISALTYFGRPFQ